MNRITLLFILLSIFLTKGFSQEFSIVYNSVVSLEPVDLIALSDGNAVFLSTDVICKINNSGIPIWSKKVEGSDIELRKVIELEDGSLIGIGEANGSVSTIVFKIDANGNSIWTKSIKGNFIYQKSFGLVETDDNHLIIGIEVRWGCSIFKLDSFGNLIWKNDFFSDEISFGALYNDQLYFNDLIETTRGEIIVCGLKLADPNSHSQKEGLIVNLNSNGEILWSKKVSNAYISGVKEYESNYYFRLFNGNAEFLVTDFNGNVQIAKKSGVSFPFFDHYRNLTILNNNSVLIHGFKSTGQDYLFEYSTDGEILNTYEFNGELLKICQFPNNEIIMLSKSNEKIMISKISQLASSNSCLTTSNNYTSSNVSLSVSNNHLMEVSNSEILNSEIQLIDFSIDFFEGCEINNLDEQNFSIKFSIHPNPTNDFIQLSTENPKGEYQLLDAQGRVVKTEEIHATNQLIDLSKLQSGIYFVEIDGNVKRFVKQ